VQRERESEMQETERQVYEFVRETARSLARARGARTWTHSYTHARTHAHGFVTDTARHRPHKQTRMNGHACTCARAHACAWTRMHGRALRTDSHLRARPQRQNGRQHLLVLHHQRLQSPRRPHDTGLPTAFGRGGRLRKEQRRSAFLRFMFSTLLRSNKRPG